MTSRRMLVLTASPSPHALPGLVWDALAAGATTDEAATAAVEPASQPYRVADDAAVRAAIEQTAGAAAVVLGEGDLLLRPEILDWIALARQGGAQAVAVETTGHILARRGAAAQLKAAGLTHVMVTLFGADAASHDWITAADGAFSRALRGLKQARAAGLRTQVLTPILRPTFRALPELVRRSLAIGVRGFEFRAPIGPDRKAHGLHPHLALAGPHVARAVQIAQAAKRSARIWGVPACALGEAAEATWARHGGQHTIDAATPTDGDRSRTQGEPCKTCAWTAHCGGPLDNYGPGFAGLSPRSTAP